LENTADIIYLTIVEFSEKVIVGEATIIRFCRKLGFKGFQDFKMILAQELSINSQSTRIVSDVLDTKDSLKSCRRKNS
jgi:Transcriptional regulators